MLSTNSPSTPSLCPAHAYSRRRAPASRRTTLLAAALAVTCCAFSAPIIGVSALDLKLDLDETLDFEGKKGDKKKEVPGYELNKGNDLPYLPAQSEMLSVPSGKGAKFCAEQCDKTTGCTAFVHYTPTTGQAGCSLRCSVTTTSDTFGHFRPVGLKGYAVQRHFWRVFQFVKQNRPKMSLVVTLHVEEPVQAPADGRPGREWAD
jgi:hypothetical protein